MVFFKHLQNILQHSNLNGYSDEDSENKRAKVFSLLFAIFYCSYGGISVNYIDYKIKICAQLISF